MRIPNLPAHALQAGIILIATPALADLSAQDVWNSWKAIASESGQEITIDEETLNGGVLTLRGITSTMTFPDGSAVGSLDELTLSEQGDGTVSIGVTPEYPFRMTATGSDDEVVNMAFVLRQTGLSFVASGDPATISYAFAAPSVEVEMTEFEADGESVELTFSMALDSASGTYEVSGGPLRSIDSALTANAMAMKIVVKDPSEEIDFGLTLAIENVSSTSTGTMSPFAGTQDLGTLLRDGLASEGTVTTGPTTYSADWKQPDGAFKFEGESATGNFDYTLDADGIRYGGGNEDVSMTLQVLSMPFPPFSLDIARSGGEFRMPLIETEAAKDLGLKMNLEGLTLSESAWAMFDPSSGLPRDPANLTIDISGKGKWNIDITNPEAMADAENQASMPGQLEAIDINSLVLSLMGAELTGSGNFVFNNEGVPPMPIGLVDLRLMGGNTLIDKLVEIGLVPEDQAMGVRMMLGLFARPGDGEDTLVSTIEVKEDGSVLANGQRIR